MQGNVIAINMSTMLQQLNACSIYMKNINLNMNEIISTTIEMNKMASSFNQILDTTQQHIIGIKDSLNEAFSVTENKTAVVADAMGEIVDDRQQKAARVTETVDKALDKTKGKAEKTAGICSKAFDKMKDKVSDVQKSFENLMKVSDSYTTIAVELARINDGMQTQAELQSKVFAAANRTQVSYENMATAIAKVDGLTAGSFENNEDLIVFTELLQKSSKVSGAEQSKQDDAFTQVTQAMSRGSLDSDGLKSVLSGAPMVAQLIAEYMNVSIEQLDILAAKGAISADIIKSAMFEASDKINKKFNELPMTFEDLGTIINNTLLESFGPVLEKINGVLNSEAISQFLEVFNSALACLAEKVNDLVDAFVQGGPIIKAIMGGLIALMAVWVIQMGIAAIASLAAAWPLLLIVAAVALVILLLNSLGVTFSDVFGFIGGLVGGMYAFIYDVISCIWNCLVSFKEFLMNVFKNPLMAITNLFLNWLSNTLSGTQILAEAIDSTWGTNFAAGLDKYSDMLESLREDCKTEDYISLEVIKMERMDIADTVDEWSGKGSEVGNIFDVWDFTSIFPDMPGTDFNPVTVEGTGQNGAVEVNMADEDIQYLRDLAQRDYIAKIASNTLAPNIHIEFSGPVTEEMSVEKMTSQIATVLQNEVAITAEGVY